MTIGNGTENKIVLLAFDDETLQQQVRDLCETYLQDNPCMALQEYSQKGSGIGRVVLFDVPPESIAPQTLPDDSLIYFCDAAEQFAANENVRVLSLPVRAGELVDLVKKTVSDSDMVKNQKIMVIGDYKFLPDQAVITGAGGDNKVKLTEKERDILFILGQQPGHVVDRNELLDRVWGYAEGVETHTLETHIYRLRQKIEDDPSSPKLLITDGAGYKITV